jgi:hypothetical protein
MTAVQPLVMGEHTMIKWRDVLRNLQHAKLYSTNALSTAAAQDTDKCLHYIEGARQWLNDAEREILNGKE